MEAMETGVPFRIGGNVMNDNIIFNLPRKACVEVTCLVDRKGMHPCVVGDLPEQGAAITAACLLSGIRIPDVTVGLFFTTSAIVLAVGMLADLIDKRML